MKRKQYLISRGIAKTGDTINLGNSGAVIPTVKEKQGWVEVKGGKARFYSAITTRVGREFSIN